MYLRQPEVTGAERRRLSESVEEQSIEWLAALVSNFDKLCARSEFTARRLKELEVEKRGTTLGSSCPLLAEKNRAVIMFLSRA